MQLAVDECESLDMSMSVVKVVAKHGKRAGSGRETTDDRTPQHRLLEAT